MPWLHTTRNGIVLSIHLSPGAKKDEIKGLYGESLKVSIKAPPVDGKANAYLTAYLAKKLDIARRQITLVKGLTSRNKKVLISGCDEHRIRDALTPSV